MVQSPSDHLPSADAAMFRDALHLADKILAPRIGQQHQRDFEDGTTDAELSAATEPNVTVVSFQQVLERMAEQMAKQINHDHGVKIPPLKVSEQIGAKQRPSQTNVKTRSARPNASPPVDRTYRCQDEV